MILVVGLSYRTAPVEVRERVATSDMPSVLARLSSRKELRESMFISTCNRVEVFAEASSGDGAADAVAAIAEELSHGSSLDRHEIAQHLYDKADIDAVRHIFRVASSLESMVVGEPQILGQIKNAYEAATTAGSVGQLLSRSIERSFQVAKRVRSETALGVGLVSVSSVAVDLARNVFGDLKQAVVLLVGAGEMGEAAAKSLGRDARELRITNRNPQRAIDLARATSATAVPFEALEDELVRADIVVVSTASETYVINPDLVKRAMKRRKGRMLLFVDIAVPRNVDPRVHKIDNVYVFDIDDLESQVKEAMAARHGEVSRAEKIVEEEVDLFQKWLLGRNVTPAVIALRERAREVFLTELERSLNGRLRHLTESDRAALTQMVESAVKKHLHLPTARLRESAVQGKASDLAASLRYLFDLEELEDRLKQSGAMPAASAEVSTEVDVAPVDNEGDGRIH